MKIEVGKCYRTRDGKGKIKIGSCNSGMYFSEYNHDHYGQAWLENGRKFLDKESPKDLVAEWKDEPAQNEEYKPWKDLTDEEKGALLLAHHEGKVIEVYDVNHWIDAYVPTWSDHKVYRIKPEPVVETVTIRGAYYRNGLGMEYKGWCFDNDWLCEGGFNSNPTHKITFQVIDGKPDVNSIKMEEL